MEKNCLVTTYKATVNDNSLLKVGEMRIKVSSVESPNKNTNGMTLYVNKDVELEIIGIYQNSETDKFNNNYNLIYVNTNVIHYKVEVEIS